MVIWMGLLLTEIALLNQESQYAEIKVIQESKRKEQIKAANVRQEGKAPSRLLTSNAALAPNDNPIPFQVPLSFLS